MALKNTSFYAYIEAAFRFKLFDSKGKTATSSTTFDYLGYNLPFNRIFYYARRVLPKFYTAEFADTEEGNLLMARKVLEKLDKHQDLELESYFDPATAPEQNVLIIAEAAQESAIQQPIGATAGTSFGGMPTVPSFSTPRRMVRIVHNVPQAEAEGKKLFVANSSGAVVGEKEITPTSVRSVPQGPVETHPIGPASSATTTVPGTETPTPKLVLARSDGTIIKEPQKPMGTQTLYTQDKSGIIREHSVKPPSRFSGFNSSIKNLGSRGGVFFQQNIGKHLTGDRAMNLLGKAGRTGMDALSGINNFGSGGGNPLSSIGRQFGRNGGGRGFFGRLGRGGGGGGGQSGTPKFSSGKKFALVGGAVFFLVFMTGLIGGINGTTPTGEAAPLPITNTNLSSCKFTRSGNSQLIKSSTLLGWMSAAAASAGIPAQVLASVAMHENQNFTSTTDDSATAIKSNQFCNKGLLFCEKNGNVLHGKDHEDDPCTADEIANGARPAQAVGLMQLLDIYNPGKDLCSITENLAIAASKLKADGITVQPTQDQIYKAIDAYYNSCAYGSFSYCNEVWLDLQNCQTTSAANPAAPGPIGFSMSCPLGSNFTVSCGTATNPVNGCGHGDFEYRSGAVCDPTYYICNGTRYSDALYKAIDVTGSNIVTLPFINGSEPVAWTRIDDQPIPIGGGGWGYKVNYSANYKGKSFLLDLTHLNNQINLAKILQSGEQVGTVFAGIGHLHMGLSVDGRWVEPIQEARICGQ